MKGKCKDCSNFIDRGPVYVGFCLADGNPVLFKEGECTNSSFAEKREMKDQETITINAKDVDGSNYIKVEDSDYETCSEPTKKHTHTAHMRDLKVVWLDNYSEEFECDEVRVGGNITWARLTSGKERIFSMSNIRWLTNNRITSEYENEMCAEASNCLWVRWFDGYMRKFYGTNITFGEDVITVDGTTTIPLHKVRWFGQKKESHQE